MRSKTGFYILIGVTILFVAAALLSQHAADRVAPELGPQFPGLSSRLDEVQAVDIQTGDGALRLARDGEGWVARSKDGYPANAERIRTLVRGVAGLRRLERKTSDPERLRLLELRDVVEPGSKAVRIGLLGSDAKPLASVLVGETQAFRAHGRSRYFVRTVGDPQAWLVEGMVPPDPGELRYWLQQSLMPGIDEGDLRSVRIRHIDGGTVTVRRDKGDAKFELADVASGETPASQRTVDAVARALRELSLNDVRTTRASAPGDTLAIVEAHTFDGVNISARIARSEKDYAVRLQASFQPDPDQAAESKDQKAGAKQLVDKLNGRWRGRVFVVSRYALDPLLVPRSTLLKAPTSSAFE